MKVNSNEELMYIDSMFQDLFDFIDDKSVFEFYNEDKKEEIINLYLNDPRFNYIIKFMKSGDDKDVKIMMLLNFILENVFNLENYSVKIMQNVDIKKQMDIDLNEKLWIRGLK